MLIHLLKDHSQLTEDMLTNPICMPKNAFDNATSLFYKGYLSKRQEELWKQVLFMVNYAKVNIMKKNICIPSARIVASALEIDYRKLLEQSSSFK